MSAQTSARGAWSSSAPRDGQERIRLAGPALEASLTGARARRNWRRMPARALSRKPSLPVRPCLMWIAPAAALLAVGACKDEPRPQKADVQLATDLPPLA